ncbi:helix-turn-helix domain-containing protein [Variovorax ginsengisoli]|uniref:AraC family transcriptional regulator n=1 Tax=Variovorax ginsengisoli TaxID=363844 RepID=A0ABT9S4D1_9BURK|nr:AraC family transcriptional regulator [Variovorax ginsengisoli]MDP9899190.1 AraC family transcriptional regulator [Variovorax ginsengisoli]
MHHPARPEELPRWVPGELLCSSDGLGWKDVGLRGYRYEGLDVEVPALTHFMIVSYLRGSTLVDRRFEGRWTRTTCHPGDVSLLTRSQLSHWHWTEPIEVTHVYLPDGLATRVAADVLDRPIADVRLHDVLRQHDPVVSGIVAAIAREAGDTAIGGAVYVDALSTQLSVHLLRHYASVDFVDHSSTGQFAPALRRRIVDYIEGHLEQSLTLNELAMVANMGVWTFAKHFRMSFLATPHHYIIDRRLDRARALLGQGSLPIKAVASVCGFADQAHLTRVMRARLGCTPAAFRASVTA